MPAEAPSLTASVRNPANYATRIARSLQRGRRGDDCHSGNTTAERKAASRNHESEPAPLFDPTDR